jgi:hypothetical protein
MTNKVPGRVRGNQLDDAQRLPEDEFGRLARQKEGARRALAALRVTHEETEAGVAEGVVARLIERHTAMQGLPDLIVGFLHKDVRRHLVELYLVEGEDSSSWKTSLRNVEQLVWSVQAKCNEESRKRLFSLLHGLYEWVHGVLEPRMIASAEDAFFSELSRLHAVALSAESSRGDRYRDGETQRPVSGMDCLADERLTPGEGPPSESRTCPVYPRPSTPDRYPALPSEPGGDPGLRIGSWVNFRKSCTTSRVMSLKWISGDGGVYVFASENTGEQMCITSERFKQRLQEQSACLL